MSFVELVCPACTNRFSRLLGEYHRSIRSGRQSFCSRKCACKNNIKNIPLNKLMRKHDGLVRRTDEYSMFRVFLNRARKQKREKGTVVQVTLEYLKALWEEQRGCCPYTGWQLKTPRSTSDHRLLTPDTASLDRIDSNKGYIEGNVQFVSFMAQCAKNVFSGDQLIGFCRAVASNNISQISA